MKLSELASTVRSKNAGVNQITFDIIFPDRETYRRVVASNAIKFTIYRLRPSGSPGDWDILGCQHYGPLLELEIPER